MNRLQAEFQRLYLVPSTNALIDDHDRVRAMVLELARPAEWASLASVWRGVQADLGLPAPAIAVSGTDGLQLWFSLVEPVAAIEAHGFLDLLRRRYLPEVARQRLRLLPEPGPSAPVHAAPLPALQPSTGNWSAFVAPDLAPLFEETPWLDIPPSDEGQAQLLAALGSLPRQAFDAALAQLQPQPQPRPGPASVGTDPAPHHPPVPGGHLGPESFLLAVINDEHAPLALRIEAAKALLPFNAPGRDSER